MANSIMSPTHPQWEYFLECMEGSEGVHFREEPAEDPIDPEKTKTVWTCFGDFRAAKAILSRMGFSEGEIEQSIKSWEDFGGYCDCEVLLNAPLS